MFLKYTSADRPTSGIVLFAEHKTLIRMNEHSKEEVQKLIGQ